MYNLSGSLTAQIKTALRFDSKKQSVSELDSILGALPLNLRLSLMMAVHNKAFENFPFFLKIGNRNFINWIYGYLKPMILTQGQVIYTEQDQIDGFYFMTKGLASYSLPKYNNMIAAVIDPERALNFPTMKMQTFQFFGCEDSVLNHVQALIADKKGVLDDIRMNQKGETLLSKRKFQVTVIKEGECLTLDNETIDKMKRDFSQVSSRFFKK